MTQRYAIYWAPEPDGALGAFGRHWLGRDARTGQRLTPPETALPPETVDEITSEPRRYGFHATLKPPFLLAADTTEDDLFRRLETFAATRAPVDIQGLTLADLGGFLALVPVAAGDDLYALAGQCVRELESFRAPPSEGDIARRRRAGLTERQESLLQRWGYPYVFEEFRFHLTLTGRLPDPDRQTAKTVLTPLVAGFENQVFRISAISVFEQPAPNTDFTIVRSFALTGTA